MLELSLVQKIVVWSLPLLFAITLHEVAHGWVASKFGDQTARLAGRLTFNPLKHIDLIGTVILPLFLLIVGAPFLFGWAKPVPIDARNLRNPRRDMIVVAAGGPFANILMAIIWALIAKLAQMSMGSYSWLAMPLFLMGQYGIAINVILAILNCLPILPLDGGRILANLLPPRYGYTFLRLEPYGILILLLLMFTNALIYLIFYPSQWLINIITSLFGLS